MELVYLDVEFLIELKVFFEGIVNWEWWLDGELMGFMDIVEWVYLFFGIYILEFKIFDGFEFCGFVLFIFFELEVFCFGNLVDIEVDFD